MSATGVPPGLYGKLAATAVVLAGLSILGKLVGLVRAMVVAAVFGAGPDLDAFLIAVTVPDLLSVIAHFVALNLFLPVFLAETRRSPAGANDLAAAFWERSLLVLGLLGIALALAAEPVVRALAPDLDPATRGKAVLALRVLSVVVLVRGLDGILRAILHARRRFAVPMLAQVAVGVAFIACVLALASRWPLGSLTVGTAVGNAMPVLILLPIAMGVVPGLVRTSWRRHPGLGEIRRKLPFLVAIESAALLLPLVDRSLASRMLGEGAISALEFGRVLVEAPYSLVAVTLAVPFFTEFSDLAAAGDREAFRAVFRRAVRGVVGVLLPVAVLVVVRAEPLVGALFERGAFDREDTVLTAQALVAYAIGLPFIGVSALGLHGSYAAGILRRLTVARATALAVKILLSVLLLRPLGHVGLALGTSAFFVVVTVLLTSRLAGGWRGLIPDPLGLLLAVALGAGSAWGAGYLLEALGPGSGALRLLGETGVLFAGCAVTWGVCRWRGIEEVLWVERQARAAIRSFRRKEEP